MTLMGHPFIKYPDYTHEGSLYEEAEEMNKNDDKAFDTKVTLWDGSEMFLSDLWKKQPLVLIFLRHLG